jgi:peptidyl-prolyl cis-trans isomerase A (cyclophilin A)
MAPDEFTVRFETTKGDFEVAVHREWAPKGADRVSELVESGFYNGVVFFRVLAGFVAQFGISGAPEVGAEWRNKPIEDDPVKASNTKGTLTFAMAGPNTRTTQLFINLADNKGLDDMGFAPVGEVTDGMDVVQSLYSEYGEGAPRGNGPDQSEIHQSGNAYLEKNFPALDKIKKAEIKK